MANREADAKLGYMTKREAEILSASRHRGEEQDTSPGPNHSGANP